MTVIVEEFRDAARVPARFEPLFVRHGQRSIFLTRDWFTLLPAYGFDRNSALSFMTASAPSGEPLAILPLAFSGARACALANFYSLGFAPLLNEDAAPEPRIEGLAAIGADLKRRCTLVQLRPMAGDDPSLPLLNEAFRRAGFIVDSHAGPPMRYRDTAGLSGSDFTAQLGSRLRNSIRRNMKAGDLSHRFSLFTTPEDTARGIGLFEGIYARSWKGAEPFPAFMPAFAAMLARRGALRLGVWEIDGRPAAAQLWIVHERHATIYKLAHDPEYDALSVGSALTLRMFQEILDRDSPARIDFGLGDEPFKSDWTPCRAERLGWLAFNPSTVTGLLQAARHRAGRLFSLSGARNGV
jgi:CelD/BcsL family acetyltransferase involved in cellulose biosynthesis